MVKNRNFANLLALSIIQLYKLRELRATEQALVCMYVFLHRYGRSPCGASASYMFEEENPPGNKNLLPSVRLL